jgi:hypothetical protein
MVLDPRSEIFLQASSVHSGGAPVRADFSEAERSMAAQRLRLGQETKYIELPGTVRAPGNLALAPKSLRIGHGERWELTAALKCEELGRYDRSFGVCQQQLLNLKHNVPGDVAELELQRFVKAVKVTGTEFTRTSGAGYMQWGKAAAVPQGRELAALCAAQIRAAGLQDDGPRGKEKVVETGEHSFRVEDAPGLSATSPQQFPFALLADFIFRVRVLTREGAAGGAAEFRYQTYFELKSDPYPEGMRAASWVPALSGRTDFRSFEQIQERFQRDRVTSSPQRSPPRHRGARTMEDVEPTRRGRSWNDLI